MRNRVLKNLVIGILAISTTASFIGCGANDTDVTTEGSVEPVNEAEADDELQEALEAADDTYMSTDGWSVKYDPELIQVNEAEDFVDFVYIGESAGTNMISISCKDESDPQKVLKDLTANWGSEEDILYTESFFPGTENGWGFWATLQNSGEGSGLVETAIAVEYNEKVLLCENIAHITGDEALDMEVSDCLAMIIDSITFEDFQPQKMFANYPGEYKIEEDGVTNSITLNEDHSGLLSIQDDIEIMWTSHEIMATDGSFKYEYKLNGDELTVDYDGNEKVFKK